MIWWCVVHNSKAATVPIKMGPLTLGMCHLYSLLPSEGQEKCRLVEALLIVKENGEWPKEFLPSIAVALRVGAKKGRTVPQLEINEQQGYALAEAVLLALGALASVGGDET